MEQQEFLDKRVFTELKNQNTGFDDKSIVYFSEEDFRELLSRVKNLGISIYEIKTVHNGEEFGVEHHESYKKKATDSNWYEKSFKTFHHKQEGLFYSAKYKVSAKLLARVK